MGVLNLKFQGPGSAHQFIFPKDIPEDKNISPGQLAIIALGKGSLPPKKLSYDTNSYYNFKPENSIRIGKCRLSETHSNQLIGLLEVLGHMEYSKPILVGQQRPLILVPKKELELITEEDILLAYAHTQSGSLHVKINSDAQYTALSSDDLTGKYKTLKETVNSRIRRFPGAKNTF